MNRLGDRDISQAPPATVSHFSMHFAILTTDSVWVEKRELGGKCPCKTGLKRHHWLLTKVILDTWQSNTGYLAKYRWILFSGFSAA